MTENNVEIAADVMSYTLSGVKVTAQKVFSPAPDGSTDERWAFNVQQIIANAGLSLSEYIPDVYVDTDEERDELGTHLVQTVVDIREQMASDRETYLGLFKAQLPAVAPSTMPTSPGPAV